MMGWLVALILFVLLIFSFGADDYTSGKKHADDTGRRSWHIYVDGTDDPAIYEGVYEKRGKMRYRVEGRGVTNTLRNLADEIDGVDVPNDKT